MIPLSVSEIHWTRSFCDEQDEDEQELGVLIVGYEKFYLEIERNTVSQKKRVANNASSHYFSICNNQAKFI